MKTNLFQISLVVIFLSAALYGCSSTPAERPKPKDGVAAPQRSSALTGTWKLAGEGSPAQTLQFGSNGTGTLTIYDVEGQVTKTSDLSYAVDDETRFRLIGPEWVTFVPCEIQNGQLTLKSTGQVFTKE